MLPYGFLPIIECVKKGPVASRLKFCNPRVKMLAFCAVGSRRISPLLQQSHRDWTSKFSGFRILRLALVFHPDKPWDRDGLDEAKDSQPLARGIGDASQPGESKTRSHLSGLGEAESIESLDENAKRSLSGDRQNPSLDLHPRGGGFCFNENRFFGDDSYLHRKN